MRRSEINKAYRDALACFARHSWALPPRPRWDITDFGLGDFAVHGLTLVNLAAESEYCEKLMYARLGQETPCHTHALKKEDIICRAGRLSVTLWPNRPDAPGMARALRVLLDGEPTDMAAGKPLLLGAGSRVTIAPGTWHSFVPASGECIIGEVSTANDDLNDNFFIDPRVGRFPEIDEDEPGAVILVSE
jgi:hypothetical protein